MMSSSQTSYTASSSQATVSNFTISSLPSSNFPVASSFLSQSSMQDSVHSDPNSPEALKQNIQTAQEFVSRVNSLARSCLNGIDQAYQPGINPAQTSADFAALDHALRSLSDFLRQTGVGALPLSPPPDPHKAPSAPPTEQELLAEAGRNVQTLYEKQKRSQESAAIVANLLSNPETGTRAGRA
ncbi:hypothetical protein BV22DRAFT_1035949 [Leucogyrophana mollusca]|uniref:Uncharacterized protein n=1 Tax=Leucogyrophana mollusca TaxID=85980 RepID=A0ACB8BEQ0_9AGAM|nr:hypothetical protein BV22DRAFT_1035949 [Leucogyrophana mollusca]